MSRARDLADGTFSGAVAAASGDFTGTIEAADFSDGTLTVGTEFVTNGSAKAWVNFNGTGAIAIQDSLNVSSLTDNAAGNYTSTFTNALSTDNYSVSFYANFNAGWGNTCYEAARSTTSHQDIVVNNQIAGTGSDDASECNLMLLGDLA